MPESSTSFQTWLAFDGSLNAQWVARYALRMAMARGGGLNLAHVNDDEVLPALYEERAAQVQRECDEAGIALRLRELPAHADIATVILDAVADGHEALLLCGTRARRHGRGLLAGSVSERLLRANHCTVLAVHVLTPGLLGRADRLLLPLAGWPGEVRDAQVVLQPLLAAARQLHLLRVMQSPARVIDRAPRAVLARLRGHGRAAVTDSERELRAALDLAGLHVDAHVRLDESWSRAAAVVARIYRCNLLLAGGSDRQLGAGRSGVAPVERLLAAAPCDVGIYRARAERQ